MNNCIYCSMRELDGMSLPCGKCSKPTKPERNNMTPLAKAAKEVFHETLRAKGRRLDQACLEEAWERVVETVLKATGASMPCVEDLEESNKKC